MWPIKERAYRHLNPCSKMLKLVVTVLLLTPTPLILQEDAKKHSNLKRIQTVPMFYLGTPSRFVS